MMHTFEAVGWTLIHSCWQLAAIAIVYRGAARVLARRSSNARYVAALVAMVAMPIAACITFAIETQQTSARFAAPANAAFAAPFIEAQHAVDATGGSDLAGTRTLHAEASARELLPYLLPWIDGFWMVGVVVLSLRSLGGWWLIQRLRRTSDVDVPEAVGASFARIAKALGLHRVATLRVSSAIAGPVTVGALRGVVLLPLSAITSLGPDELEMVLAHELAHIKRADFVWNLAQTAIETLFFFHPAVWWVGAQLRHERELCCDDLALTVCPNPVAYASALVRLEEQRARHMQLAMALDGHQPAKTLRMRVARILGEPTGRSSSQSLRPISATAAVVALIAVMVPAPQVIASLDPAQTKAGLAAVIANAGDTVKPRAAHLMAQAGVVATASPSQASQPAAPPTGVVVQAGEVAVSPAEEFALDAQKTAGGQTSGADYIDQMKAAGYGDDLDQLIAMKIQGITPDYAKEMSQAGLGKLTGSQLVAMKIQGVTPEYIRAMQQAGFGKLSADDIVACKIQGVTPEYLNQLKSQGFAIENAQQAVSFRIFHVTPEFLTGMKAAGFDHLTADQVISLRVQNVTPEFAKDLTQQYSGITVDNLVQAKIFHIDANFVAAAKRHGFTNLSFEKLMQLRISGLIDDEPDAK